MRLFTKKSTFIVFLTALILIASFLFIAKLKFIPLNILYPFQYGVNFVIETFDNSLKLLKDKKELINKANKLELENQKLKLEIIKYQNEIENVKMVMPIISFVDKYKIKNYTVAKVIGFSPDNWNQSFYIDKGKNDNIKVGDLVVSNGYLIGIVEIVGSYSSEVMSISDKNFKISVRTRKTQEICFSQGLENRKGILKYVRPEQDIRIGDILETTVVNSEATEGIPVGIIRKIAPKEGEFFREIEVETFYYPYNLNYVLVIKR